MVISYSQALEIIQNAIEPICTTQVNSLLQSLHRIASHNIAARWDMPQHAISLKEGFGLHLEQTLNYTLYHDSSSHGLPLRHAISLSTGDVLTQGITTIVPKEEVLIHDNGTITIPSSLQPHQHIKQQGEDIAAEEIILKQNERINAYTLTALASQGIEYISTYSPPKVSILSVGNHLASLGEDKTECMVYNSNAITLAARVVELGGIIEAMEVCNEDCVTIHKTLQKLSQKADFIITTGGMGTDDGMHRFLATKQLPLLFHSVQISPARPSALSLIEKKPILHLPGLPLSCLLGFEMLGASILKHLQHIPFQDKPCLQLINQHTLTCKACSTSAIPGLSDGKTFTNAPAYRAGMLNTLAACNGYILTEGKEEIGVGEQVTFFPF